jgi:hypothetical protein
MYNIIFPENQKPAVKSCFQPSRKQKKKLLLNHWDELFLVERFVLLFNSSHLIQEKGKTKNSKTCWKIREDKIFSLLFSKDSV